MVEQDADFGNTFQLERRSRGAFPLERPAGARFS